MPYANNGTGQLLLESVPQGMRAPCDNSVRGYAVCVLHSSTMTLMPLCSEITPDFCQISATSNIMECMVAGGH